MTVPPQLTSGSPFHRGLLLQGLLLSCFAACQCGGLPPEEEPQPEPQPPPALTLTAPTESVELATGWQVEVPLVLSGLGEEDVTWNHGTLPEGVSARFERAGDAAGTDFVLTMHADADAVLGETTFDISATGSSREANAPLTLEVISGVVRGIVLSPDGEPLQGALVNVIGADGASVEVDASGAWKIPHRERPYHLRVEWPETGSVHVYRHLEVDTLELYPFRQENVSGSLTHAATFNGWLPEVSLRSPSLWVSSEVGPARRRFLSHAANGELSVGVGFAVPGPGRVELLSKHVNDNQEVTAYAGYIGFEGEFVPDLVMELGVLDFQPVETFSFSPTFEVPPELSFSESCSYLEPSHLRHIHCAYGLTLPLLFPQLDGAPGRARFEFSGPEGATTVLTVLGLGPSTPSAELSVPSPPRLLEPIPNEPHGSVQVHAADGRFLVEMAGDAPLTFTFSRGAEVLHITTPERELAVEELRPLLPEAESTPLVWSVRALPGEAELNLRSPGAVIAAEDWSDGLPPADLGRVPVTTKSRSGHGTIVW